LLRKRKNPDDLILNISEFSVFAQDDEKMVSMKLDISNTYKKYENIVRGNFKKF